MGERTPHLDASARGGWIGLTAKHKRADLIRSLLEGVSYSQKDCLDIIERMGVSLDSVRASGGGARSPFWRQMLADVFAKRVVTLETQEGSAYGAALLALVGTGVYRVGAGSLRKQQFAKSIRFLRSRMPCASTPRDMRVSVAVSGLEAVLPWRMTTLSGADPLVRSGSPSDPLFDHCVKVVEQADEGVGADRGVRPTMIYCDVSLPVPLDQSFTYRLPETLRHRVQPGCRVLVPFGTRKLTGIVLEAARPAAGWPGEGSSCGCSTKSRCSRCRTPHAGPLDLAVLLRAARRSAARHDAAQRRGSQDQALFAHRRRARCRAAALAGRRPKTIRRCKCCACSKHGRSRRRICRRSCRTPRA